MKKLKKEHKLKKIKKGALKNKSFRMINSGGGFVPRDPNFPVGEDQYFAEEDVVDG